MDDATTEALDRIAFLAASPTRPRILDALAEGAATPDRLEERLDVPRSTLRRNLSALVDRGYVARSATDNGYALTDAGRIVRASLADALSAVETAESLVPFLDSFPVDLPVSAEALSSCDVVVARPNAPYGPVSAVRDWVTAADDVRGFTLTINPVYLEALQDHSADHPTLTVVVPASTRRSLSEHYGDELEAFESHPGVTLEVAASVPEYALGFVDGALLLGAFDDHGRTHSVLRAGPDSPLQEWARTKYDDVSEDAEPV